MKNIKSKQTWHHKYKAKLTLGQELSDKATRIMGSWPFVIGQTILIVFWIVLNLIGYFRHWDPYPFILLNLLFSVQAAYAFPIVMMAQNRQNERDRVHAQEDLATDRKAEREIKEIQKTLARIDNIKLNKILAALKKKR